MCVSCTCADSLQWPPMDVPGDPAITPNQRRPVSTRRVPCRRSTSFPTISASHDLRLIRLPPVFGVQTQLLLFRCCSAKCSTTEVITLYYIWAGWDFAAMTRECPLGRAYSYTYPADDQYNIWFSYLRETSYHLDDVADAVYRRRRLGLKRIYTQWCSYGFDQNNVGTR